MIMLSNRLYCGPDCLSKSKNLREDFDSKEWHFIKCRCDCSKEAIKGGKCIQCEHLQYARPLTVVENHTISASLPEKNLTPKKALENLFQRYSRNILSANKQQAHRIE
jgi:hypothetical protein